MVGLMARLPVLVTLAAQLRSFLKACRFVAVRRVPKAILLVLAASPLSCIREETAGGNGEPKLYPVLKGGQWGYIDKTGKLVIEPRFKEASVFSDGLARVVLTDNFGYIDCTGKLVIEDKYFEADDFSEGVAFALEISIPGRLIFIDKKGNVALSPKDKGVGVNHRYPRFSGGYAALYIGHGCGVLDKHGKVLVKPEYMHLDNFSHGLARAFVRDEKWGKWGYMNTSGRLAIPAKFDLAYSFSEGLACVGVEVGDERYKLGYINPKGEYAFKLDFETARISGDSGMDQYEDVWGWRFSDGLARVRSSIEPYHWGYIDKKGKFVIPPQFEHACDFAGGLARVYDDDGKISFIDTRGKTAFRVSAYHSEDFVGELAQVSDGDKIGYINRKGECVWPLTE
jgi:hypothetical protein